MISLQWLLLVVHIRPPPALPGWPCAHASAHKAATQFPAANLWDAGMSKKTHPGRHASLTVLFVKRQQTSDGTKIKFCLHDIQCPFNLSAYFWWLTYMFGSNVFEDACSEVCWFFVDILLTIVSGACTVDLFSSGIREEWNLSFALHPRKIGGRANYQLWWFIWQNDPNTAPTIFQPVPPPAGLAWPVNSSVLNYWTAIRLNSKPVKDPTTKNWCFFPSVQSSMVSTFKDFFYVFGLFYPP